MVDVNSILKTALNATFLVECYMNRWVSVVWTGKFPLLCIIL